MQDVELIRSIGIMIVAAAAAVLLLRRAKVPTIVIYILVGLLLGPVLGWFVGVPSEAEAPAGRAEEAVELIAQVGIALLLFLVGLALSVDKIRDVGRVAVLAGLGQVVFTTAFGFVLAWLLGFDWLVSIVLATALTFSSTVVVVKLLEEKKEIDSLYGRIAVGIFLVQDLVVVVALTFLAGLGTAEPIEAGAGEGRRDFAAVAVGLGWAFLGMAGLLAAALVASRYLLARPFEWAAGSAEMLLAWSLCWCFGFVVAADWLGLSPEIGAFLAGLSLAQLRGAEDLRRRVHPLMNFFIAVFFISLGAQMELGAATEHALAAVVLSLFVLVGNPFIFMWIIAWCGYRERTSFLTSVTVAQISEFSFIFAAMGLAAGLIDESVLSLVMLIGLVTIGASSYMILYNHVLYRWCRRIGLLRMFRARQGEEEEADRPADRLAGHLIVVGMNALGRRLAADLHQRGERVLAIDTDARKLRGLPCRTLQGDVDYLSVVEDAALARAKLAVSTLQIEDTNSLLAYRCGQLGVPTAIHAFDRSVIDDLRRLGVEYLIDSKAQGGRQVIGALEAAGIVKPP